MKLSLELEYPIAAMQGGKMGKTGSFLRVI
jgi:hypothetical protein